MPRCTGIGSGSGNNGAGVAGSVKRAGDSALIRAHQGPQVGDLRGEVLLALEGVREGGGQADSARHKSEDRAESARHLRLMPAAVFTQRPQR